MNKAGVNSRYVCNQSDCTACGACLNVCPKQSISFEKDSYDRRVAVIDQKTCVGCRLCEKVCSQYDHVKSYFNAPMKCYAGWSNDENVRKNSASGGIATELYRFFAKRNCPFCGAIFKEKGTVEFELVEGLENFTKFQNSKYVESYTNDIYRNIAAVLQDRQVLFIGLPCQVDGLKRYLDIKKIDAHNLFTVDIVCHGTTPLDYLLQHIEYCERKNKFRCSDVSFRDPKFETKTFTFSLKEDGILKYHKKVNRNDGYQIGYHKGINYRENCYRCKYANSERVSDLTISDFSGLGKISECNYTNVNTSCILVNTERGMNLLNEMHEDGVITIYERPLDEALKYEKQLMHPTIEPAERKQFLETYVATHEYEKSIKVAARKIILCNELRYYSCVDRIRLFLRRVLPSTFKIKVKSILKLK